MARLISFQIVAIMFSVIGFLGISVVGNAFSLVCPRCSRLFNVNWHNGKYDNLMFRRCCSCGAAIEELYKEFGEP